MNKKILINELVIENGNCSKSYLKTFYQETNLGVLITEVYQNDAPNHQEFVSVSSTFIQIFGGEEEIKKFIASMKKK